jgi:hypothetical protein
LINLVCDRSLLAAYSGRTSRVSVDMVYHAADNLELLHERPSRFNWFRRASVVVMAAGATVTLGVAATMVAPVLRASAATTESQPAATDVVPVSDSPAPAPTAADATTVADALNSVDVSTSAPVGAMADKSDAPTNTRERYSVMTASFPLVGLTRADSAARAQQDAVIGQLQSLGYDVRLMDVNLGNRGEWRRVLVGEFATQAEAKTQANRVRQTPAFTGAQVIRY